MCVCLEEVFCQYLQEAEKVGLAHSIVTTSVKPDISLVGCTPKEVGKGNMCARHIWKR